MKQNEIPIEKKEKLLRESPAIELVAGIKATAETAEIFVGTEIEDDAAEWMIKKIQEKIEYYRKRMELKGYGT